MRRTALVAWVLGFALMMGWALITPTYGSPDGWAHESRAYGVAHGEWLPVPYAPPENPSSSGFGMNTAPQSWLFRDITNACFRFKPTITPDCSPDLDQSSALLESPTSAGRYPPLYYFVTGLPSLVLSAHNATWGMRAVGAALAAMCLAWAAMAASTRRRPGVALAGIAVAATPATLYLGGSVNPNALEIMAGLATIACGLGAIQEDRPDVASALMRRALIAAAIMVSGRIVAPVWLVCLVLVLALLVPWREWPRAIALFRRPLFVVALATGIGLVVWSRTLGKLDPAVVATPTDLKVRVRESYEFVTRINEQWFGSFGWLEVKVSDAVTSVALWSVLVLVLVCAGLSRRPVRVLLATAAIASSTVLVGTLVSAATYDALGGVMWQLRYALPLAVAIPVVATFVAADHWRPREDSPADRVGRGLIALAVAGAAALHVYGFDIVLRRYVSAGGSPFDGPWQPPFGSVPVFTIQMILTGLAAALVLRTLMGQRSRRTIAQ